MGFCALGEAGSQRWILNCSYTDWSPTASGMGDLDLLKERGGKQYIVQISNFRSITPASVT